MKKFVLILLFMCLGINSYQVFNLYGSDFKLFGVNGQVEVIVHYIGNWTLRSYTDDMDKQVLIQGNNNKTIPLNELIYKPIDQSKEHSLTFILESHDEYADLELILRITTNNGSYMIGADTLAKKVRDRRALVMHYDFFLY